MTKVNLSTISRLFNPWGIAHGVFNGYSYDDKKIYRTKGLILRSTDTIRRDKIESVDFTQGLAGRMFGYGSLNFTGSGGKVVSFKYVKNVKSIAEQLDG